MRLLSVIIVLYQFLSIRQYPSWRNEYRKTFFFQAYFHEEMKTKRSQKTYHDQRVHACLYFIAPTGHSLKSLDLVCMKKLDKKVNIIPIIAKADTISKNEIQVSLNANEMIQLLTP